MIKTILSILCPAIGLSRTHVAAATIGAAAVGAVGSGLTAANSDAQAQSAAANSNSPWSKAQPYLEYGYGQAQTALNNAMGMGVYSGERVASLNPYQTQGADSTAAYANGYGVNSANQLYSAGSSMLNQGANYGSNATSLLQQSINPYGSLDMGNQYANSSVTQNMINAADYSASQNLNETTLPSLLTQAEGQGGNDNTRTGVAMGVATSQAQQNMLANASNIQGQMFNEGANQYNTGIANGISANNQVGTAFNLGNSGLLNGQEASGNNFNQLEAAGGVYQNQQQNVDNAAQEQFQQQQNTDLGLLQQYQGIINGSYGGAPVSSVGPSTLGGVLQGLAGGALSGYGASKMLGGYTNSGASGLYGGQSALDAANASADPIGTLATSQGWYD